MDYSQRFRDNLEDTLEQMLPVLSFIPFVLTLVVKGYSPEYSWMTCFLAVLGSHVLQILFVVTVNSEEGFFLFQGGRRRWFLLSPYTLPL